MRGTRCRGPRRHLTRRPRPTVGSAGTGVGREKLQVKPLQFGAGIHAELIGNRAAGLRVGRQRLGLTTRRVK